MEMKDLKGLTRRKLVQAACVAPLAGAGLALSSEAALAAPVATVGVYKALGVKTFINAYGTLTTLSGTLMPPEVVKAMAEASHNFIKIHDLQDKVGKRL